MKHYHLLLSFLLLYFSPGASAQSGQPLFPGLQGQELRQALRQAYKPRQVLGYGLARDVMYREIDKVNDSVYCVYSSHGLYLDPEADPSQYLYQNGHSDGINCEHAWPQSKGAREGNAKSDLHHLFPTRIAVNDARGNYPYGEIEDRQARQWFYQAFARNTIPPPFSIDWHSEARPGLFEPREAFKGDIARAMFYFYTMYQAEADAADPAFFRRQLETFCQWHQQDPPDGRELARTHAIARYQDGKPNPYILDPSLVARAFCE